MGLGVVVANVCERIIEEAKSPPASPGSQGASRRPSSASSNPNSSGLSLSPADDRVTVRIAQLRCCIACRVVIEQAQEAVAEFERHAAIRKADATRMYGVEPVSAEVTRMFRSIDRLLPRYNDLANALWAGEQLSKFVMPRLLVDATVRMCIAFSNHLPLALPLRPPATNSAIHTHVFVVQRPFLFFPLPPTALCSSQDTMRQLSSTSFSLSFPHSHRSLFFTRYDEATKTLSQIEAAASQIADWTKIATDAVRFAQRDIEARVATAVLARIDVMSVQDKVEYLA